MNVLVACEISGVVRDAFRNAGHNAWSCDLVDIEDREPGACGEWSNYHLTGDALIWAYGEVPGGGKWDLMIAHPPCTYLCNSGVLRLYKGGKKANGSDKERWIRMVEGARFYRTLALAPIRRICMENPIMHRYAAMIISGVGEPGPVVNIYNRQTVQPYEFGDDASKATVLTLVDLPRLVKDPAQRVPGRLVDGRERWANQTDSGQNKLPPSADRGAKRAVTYPGIARAMAAQWGAL